MPLTTKDIDQERGMGAERAAKKQPGFNTENQAAAAVRDATGNEIFFGLVGPAGAGCSRAAKRLIKVLETTEVDGQNFHAERIKASDLILNWSSREGSGAEALPKEKSLERVTALQDLGDEMRSKKGEAAIAIEAVDYIRNLRAHLMGSGAAAHDQPVRPDAKPRAYIVDSLKHPSEVRLLREIYGESFILIGVVCEEEEREKRLIDAFYTRPKQTELGDDLVKKRVRKLMARDSGENEKDFGQHVTDTFHMSDYFVDNTLEDEKDVKTQLNEEFLRLIEVVFHRQIRRPRPEETAMHMAYSASLRSFCLSRQVGACLTDVEGNILATGVNEVPAAGGGVYGERADDEVGRCYFKNEHCSSNKVQNELIAEVIEMLTGKTENFEDESYVELLKKVRNTTSLGGLIEFSRAVHAEMDAILSAARSGANINGSKLFVTTFPCHYCARHIVTAGISEVYYIEPYPKSRALALHDDSITTEVSEWEAAECPTTVLFRPFMGFAPRLYQRVFVKDRPYKNKITGDFEMGAPKGTSPWQSRRIDYSELELRVVSNG